MLRLVQDLDNSFALRTQDEIKQAENALEPLFKPIGYMLMNPCMHDIGQTGKVKKMLDLAMIHLYRVTKENLYQRKKGFEFSSLVFNSMRISELNIIVQLRLDFDSPSAEV